MTLHLFFLTIIVTKRKRMKEEVQHKAQVQDMMTDMKERQLHALWLASRQCQ
ncbi:MAG: YrzI family small protein [Ectobacillus sp.]